MAVRKRQSAPYSSSTVSLVRIEETSMSKKGHGRKAGGKKPPKKPMSMKSGY